MSGRRRGLAIDCRTPLTAGWSVCGVPAGSITQPAQWAEHPQADWITADDSGTVAAALRNAKRWSLDDAPRRFEAEDWWFRLHFDAPASDAPRALAFGGLAGLAEVWLNGEPLLKSANMFVSHECAAPGLRPSGNELLIRFASLDAALAQRRPRPRWRVPMLVQQQLRWIRTSLLGHAPGWMPPVAPIGPWRGVELVECGSIRADALKLRAHLQGREGVVSLSTALTPADVTARLELERNGITHRAALIDGRATLVVPDAALWWPHTHGTPALYEARLVVQARGTEPVTLPLGAIGFRSLALDTRDGDFAVRINDTPVFCRGACWMPLDPVGLRASPLGLRAALEQFRDAGMNMVRVSGTMVYEDDAFHDLCDELGILVWQDFMFANMDYPHTDPSFAASVRQELEQQLQRWQARPSMAVLCGNSEAEQQAAMWGSGREQWAQPEFDRQAIELIQAWCPDVPYWPSSAHGGSFPHQNDVGTTSYYGVGAYRRPLTDARHSGVRFATECLALANIPPESTLARVSGGSGLRVHHAAWHARAPRDLGAGWDFDDIRDHYLQRLYGLDPFELRASDHERYLGLGRATSAELMRATFAEWRRGASHCRGAIVWYLRDLWAGAGWGLVDERGTPKAAYHGVKQACAPIAIALTDEGTNGLALHVVNDPADELACEIEVALYRDDGLYLQRSTRAQRIAGHSAPSWNLGDWFDGFIDVSRAYRFGPVEHALVVATLRVGDQVLGEAFHFPEGLPSRREYDIGLQADARTAADGSATVELRTRALAQSLHFEVPGFVAQDEYFHLAPGATRRVVLRPDGSGAPLRGSVHALNARGPTAIKVS